MNIESRRVEAKDRQEEACQDPGETMFEPPLKVSILFYPSRAGESTPVTWGITCPTHSGWFLHLSASCPIESPRLSKLEGAFQVNLSAKLESSGGQRHSLATLVGYSHDRKPFALWHSLFHGQTVQLSKFSLICHSATSPTSWTGSPFTAATLMWLESFFHMKWLLLYLLQARNSRFPHLFHLQYGVWNFSF